MTARVDPHLRRRTIAAIHVLAAQLGMDTHDENPDSEYRCALWTIARTRSCADMDHTGLQRTREHFAALARSRGLNTRPGAGKTPGRPRNMSDPDRGPSLRKIEALLLDAGRSWAYVSRGTNGRPSMVKRICGVDAIEFGDVDGLHRLIAALVIDQKRRRAKEPSI